MNQSVECCRENGLLVTECERLTREACETAGFPTEAIAHPDPWRIPLRARPVLGPLAVRLPQEVRR